jgi:hypothetical protein
MSMYVVGSAVPKSYGEYASKTNAQALVTASTRYFVLSWCLGTVWAQKNASEDASNL